jgi:hypothetical protein
LSAGAPSHRRSRLPVILLSLLLVLFAAGAVAIAQLYWSSLRTGIGRMQVSVATAQREQERLLARVRAAEAALRARAELPLTTADPQPEATARGASPAPAPGARAAAPWRELTPPARAELAARLDALARDVARLPVGPRPALPAGNSPVAAKRLLADQLAVARTAAAAGDLALLDAALYAAARLAAPPYRTPTGRDGDLPATLRRLRAGLRAEPPTAPAASRPAPIRLPSPAPAR